jgi:hypothetical protein
MNQTGSGMSMPQPKAIKVASRRPNWPAVEERLRKERQRELPKVDTSAAIHEFGLAWKVAAEKGMERKGSGLVEQQACFRLLREPEAG